ncbi:hypothetical protein B296_00026208, partial [Ensete ventricosum]
YTIPMGCKVFLSFRAVHLDNEYFDDARTFDPWRWQVGGPTVYTPFGGGSRLCPGYELARVVISVFLHYLVTRFKAIPSTSGGARRKKEHESRGGALPFPRLPYQHCSGYHVIGGTVKLLLTQIVPPVIICSGHV